MNYKNQMVSCLEYQAAFFFFVNQALLLCEVYIFYQFYNFLICRLTSVGNVVIFMDKFFSVCHTLHLYAVFFLYIFRDAFISLFAVFKVRERHLPAGLKCITYVCKTHRRPS